MSDGGAVEEIKAKLDIVDIVQEYVQLKKSGTRMAGLCPFHSEKSASFSVTPDMQFWYCFGCNEGGDMFSFIQRIEGLEFVDALKLLADKAGVKLERQNPEKSSERQKLIEINTWAAKYFHEVLIKSDAAKTALEYAKKRDLSPETLDNFAIGFAPDSWDATLRFLEKKGYKAEDIVKAGLATKKSKGPGFFDRFRGRLMFSIRDSSGNVVAFTGRIMPGPDGKDPKEAKYVNTQETSVYHKGRILFGLDMAKQAIRKEGVAVVVEGNMDVVASHQAGVNNVVASSGTALSVEQLNLLKRITKKLVFSFDADAAGERAARRGIDLAVAEGFTVRILRLPPDAGKDPDDCIRKDVALWKQAIADAVPFMTWYIQLVNERTDFTDPDEKKIAAAELLTEVAKLPDPVERAHWLKELSVLFRTPESLLFEQVQKARGKNVSASITRQATQEVKTRAVRASTQRSRHSLISEHVIGMTFAWPKHLIDAAGFGLTSGILAQEFGELYSNFVIYYNEVRSANGQFQNSDLKAFVDRENNDTAKALAAAKLRAEQEFSGLNDDERKASLSSLIGEIKRLHSSQLQKELTQAMAQAESAGDMHTIQEIQQKLNTLMQETKHE